MGHILHEHCWYAWMANSKLGLDNTHSSLEAGKEAAAGSKLDRHGAVLSDPNEARSIGKVQPSSAADKFPSADGLLNQLHGKDESPVGPTFPLDKPYDPTKDYMIDGKPTERGKELQEEAHKLLAGVAKPDGTLTLRDQGKIMDSIAKDPQLSEGDKWYLYKQVCDLERKGRDNYGWLIPGTKEYRVLFNAQRPTGIPESLKGDVVRHVIIDPTDDGYHGDLVYGKGTWRSGFQTGENGIYFHEHIEKPLANLFRSGVLGVDRGDEEESKRQIAALRAMQKGGFNAYAEEWKKGFAN